MKRTWTTEQEQMVLDADYTDEELSVMLGKTLHAIRDKRYSLTGHTIPNPKYLSYFEKLDRVESEARIINMAKQLNVRLGDVK